MYTVSDFLLLVTHSVVISQSVTATKGLYKHVLDHKSPIANYPIQTPCWNVCFEGSSSKGKKIILSNTAHWVVNIPNQRGLVVCSSTAGLRPLLKHNYPARNCIPEKKKGWDLYGPDLLVNYFKFYYTKWIQIWYRPDPVDRCIIYYINCIVGWIWQIHIWL